MGGWGEFDYALEMRESGGGITKRFQFGDAQFKMGERIVGGFADFFAAERAVEFVFAETDFGGVFRDP